MVPAVRCLCKQVFKLLTCRCVMHSNDSMIQQPRQFVTGFHDVNGVYCYFPLTSRCLPGTLLVPTCNCVFLDADGLYR